MNGRRSHLRANVLEAALAAALLVVAVIFTVWPEALEHAPVGFETRGIVHHAWHYMLLFGSGAMLAGVVIPDVRAELAGLALTISMATMNLTALLSDSLSGDPSAVTTAVAGYGIGLRVGLVVGLSLRLWVLTTQLRVGRRLRELDGA